MLLEEFPKIGSLISKGISILWIIHLFLLIPVLTTINWEKFDQLLPFFVRDSVQYITFIEKWVLMKQWSLSRVDPLWNSTCPRNQSRGFKVWTLADAHNGYVLQIEIYTGKKGNTPEKGLGARVVKDLSSELQWCTITVMFMCIWKKKLQINSLSKTP